MNNIINIITEYANAYEKLEEFQKNNKEIIPIGDQKTGVIGEFLGAYILKSIFPKAIIELSKNHSQKGFDISINENEILHYYQIKTISEYSETGISSKVHLHFRHNALTQKLNGLLIIFLKKNLLEGEYILLNEKEIEEFDGKRLSRKKLINNAKTKQFKYGDNL